MAVTRSQYNPDYAVSPGAVLKERLEVLDISQAEFARRCGRSAKLISEIISGKAPLEPETVLQFEKVLGVDASIWSGIETNYQIHRARKLDAENAAAHLEWAKSFPVRELIKRKYIQRPDSEADTVLKLLQFFGVGSVDAWHIRYNSANVSWFRSASSTSNEAVLTTWLRLGELEAELQDCKDYNQGHFIKSMEEIRKLTREPIDKALQQASLLCNQAGVALALIHPFPNTVLSGAAWWYSPRKAVIQLNALHKSDDHLWLSFFHEAAHIILHSKRRVFVDETKGELSQLEFEANDWALRSLVSKSLWQKFLAEHPKHADAIKKFAEIQGIAPGIVVGMMQREGNLPRSRLNQLKVHYQ